MGAHADNRRAALREAVMAAAKSVTAKPKINRQQRRALARSKAAHPANKSTALQNIAAMEAALKKVRS